MPPAGLVPEDYVFQAQGARRRDGPGVTARTVLTSKNSLVIYSMMFPRAADTRPRPARRAAQYPLPPELLLWPAEGAAAPEAVTSCHTPPDRLRPLPLACPGAVSAT